jgi:hypothetical protein
MVNSFSENCTVYEITLKNMLEPDRPQMKYNAAQKKCDLHAG